MLPAVTRVAHYANRSSRWTVFALAGFLTALAGNFSMADEASERALADRFSAQVIPFVQSYCLGCHGGDKPEAELDLDKYGDLKAVGLGLEYWDLVRERVEANEMPPEDAEKRPSAEERHAFLRWIKAFRDYENAKHAGDPGPVLARRLSNAEYDYTIRDLTGVDIRPTREFPVDPANQAGFDNSGESLAMSPSLVKKYLQVAQQVASQMALTPDGLIFAPHPMLVETDRDKYCVRRIVDFYRRQPTDYADYFEAAWRFRHREGIGIQESSLEEIANRQQISAKYLHTVWSLLTNNEQSVGPIAKLQSMWNELPVPQAGHQPDALRPGVEAMRDFVITLRAKLEWDFQNLSLRGFSNGGQAFLGWKNRQFATHRRTLNPETLQIEGETQFKEVREGDNTVNGSSGRRRGPTKKIEVPPDPDLTIPADEALRPAFVAAFERFCDVFPDTFYRAERGRMHFDKEKEKEDKGRYLSAGFHNMMGYFRDDQPLYELILDDEGRRELDRLWTEFHFIAHVPERQHAEFIFYERAETSTMRGPEFDFARSEDKNVTSYEMVRRLESVYLEKARKSVEDTGADPMLLDVIAKHFEITNHDIRSIERIRANAEPRHLEALLDFARRAYRRPLLEAERDGLLGFYHSLREQGMDHENALRDCVASVLMSPHFCYRIDLENSDVEVDVDNDTPVATRPLGDYALASRLSYFLWSSMPDDELLSLAASGDLHRPEVLVQQTRRMLQDERARGLATEFCGNWLEFRRFQQHNAVDRERFPSFDDELRNAMYEEPLRFFLDVIRSDRSVLDFLYADDTFVNPVLARHYGIPGVEGDSDTWVNVSGANAYGRGGLLPMAVFLTQNSPGLRTSPVKRGYWVARRVLGERIPPPPAVVPELPRDEAKMELSLRETLAKHRADPSCAACHARFDSLGFVFEEFGPIGERRDRDLAGRPVDTRAAFPNGTEDQGIGGLRRYIRDNRQDDVVENLCGKLFAYALGRTLIPSDQPTIEELQARLADEGYRFSTLAEGIVTSLQFTTKRVGEGVIASSQEADHGQLQP